MVRDCRTIDPRVGYRVAALNAVISGFAVYVNSVGVRMFSDSTLYTTLKNGVVGVVCAAIVLSSRSRRLEFARLNRREWSLLVLVALLAGSIAYVLYFRGLQVGAPATAALIDHSQFLLVAAFAALALHERVGGTVAAALLVLAIGLLLGLELHAVRMSGGVPNLIAGTVLFAGGAVVIKVALRTVSAAAVAAGKMTLGSLLLFGWAAASGKLGGAAHLSAPQWGFVLATGLLLLAFTLTEIVGLRHASATGVTAISASAPIVTTLLVDVTRRVEVSPLQLLGAAVVLTAAVTIYAVGSRRESAQAARTR